MLAGNFQSYNANSGAVHYAKLKEHFTALGRLLNRYPQLRVRGGRSASSGLAVGVYAAVIMMFD